MVNQQLIEYFQDGISKGISPMVLKNDLLRQGFSGYEIDEAYRFVDKNFRAGTNTSIFYMVKRGLVGITIFVFVLILGIILFKFFSGNKIVLTTENLPENKSIIFDKENLIIDFNSVSQVVSINSLGDNFVEINFKDRVEKFEEDTPRPIDLDGDSIKETVILFDGFVSGKPKFVFMEYSVCIEEWECDDWEKCNNGFQSRTCRDINSCGTIAKKPETTRSCKGIFDIPI